MRTATENPYPPSWTQPSAKPQAPVTALSSSVASRASGVVVLGIGSEVGVESGGSAPQRLVMSMLMLAGDCVARLCSACSALIISAYVLRITFRQLTVPMKHRFPKL
jgi:hypothetical protein